MDGISILPDELLLNILSRLTLKEATASSILARRWRYLWTFTRSLNFDFDGTQSLWKFNASNYVKWVNHVIASRNDDSTVVDFKVGFHLRKSDEQHLHKWFRYALERKVQTLHLHLGSSHDHHHHLHHRHNNYFCSLPYRILLSQQGIHFRQIRTISLQAVNVSGATLEFFLRNCPLLEHLSVCESTHLVSLRVIGPYPSLKLLEIGSCDVLESVQIRRVNLVSLKYSGADHVKFVVENVPLLVELFVGAQFVYLTPFLMQFSSVLGRLEELFIQMHQPAVDSEWQGFNSLKLSNLKKLVVKYSPSDIHGFSLLHVTHLIRAAPRLERFELKSWLPERMHNGGCDEIMRAENMEKKNLYGKLKEVVFTGFEGAEYELELVMHFVENAAALQKITIQLELMYYRNIEAVVLAHQLLAAQVPHPIILEIL